MDDEKVINCLTMPFHAIKATIPVTAPSDLKASSPPHPSRGEFQSEPEEGCGGLRPFLPKHLFLLADYRRLFYN